MTVPIGRVILVFVTRELRRFTRQPARVVAALGTPALIGFFLASGVGESFRAELPGRGYAAYVVPGVMTLVAVFTAIFASLTIIEERQEGWLPAALVTAAPRTGIALGKIAGGAIVAFVQAALVLPIVIWLDLVVTPSSVLLVLLALGLTAVSMTALGVVCAWRSPSSASFHAVMNLVFMPMWLLSGALFPTEGSATWLAVIMRVNPLTWATEAIRGPLTGQAAWGALGLTALAAVVFTGLAIVVVSRSTLRDSEEDSPR